MRLIKWRHKSKLHVAHEFYFHFSKYDSDVTEESDNSRSGQTENKRDDPMVDLFPDDDHEDNRNNKCESYDWPLL